MAKQEPNRRELALLRGKESPSLWDSWVTAFAGGDPDLAKRYAQAIALFSPKQVPQDERYAYLGQLAPATRAAYSTALAEFFEFLARRHKKIVPPHDVTRLDAEAYVEWLANRPFTLEQEKLRDGDQPERLAIYEIVKQLGSSDALSIAKGLPKSVRDAHPPAVAETRLGVDRLWLNKELGRMVLHDLLVRSPTWEQLRQEDPRIGIDRFTVNGQDVWDIFSYSLPKPKPVSRATIALRLAALSSFWDALSVGDARDKPVLQWNPWKLLKRRVTQGLAAERTRAAAEQRVDPIMVDRLLTAADGTSLPDKRDLALVRFLALTGARVSEAVQLRRAKPPASEEHRWKGWLDTSNEPAVIEVTRKGGKRQRLPFPPYAMEALSEFHAELKRHVPPPQAQREDPEAPWYVSPDSPRWRYKLLYEEPDSPLFPPVHFWGANSTLNYQEFKPNIRNTFGGTNYKKGLTRHGVSAILKKVALKAGMTEEEISQIHPHALRHFAATAMAKEGKNLREIQAILGHGSITTTEKYLAEEESLVALSGQNEILSYLAKVRAEHGVPTKPDSPPTPAPKVHEPKVPVETYGVPVTGRRERTEPKSEPDQLPAHVLPESPAFDDEPKVVVSEHKGKLVAIEGKPEAAVIDEVRAGISPGEPKAVYDAMRVSEAERQAGVTEKPELIQWQYPSKNNSWLNRNYEGWPYPYGLGQSSVLVWFAKGSPRRDGVVMANIETWDPETKKMKQEPVPIAPIPVLAPAQVNPETVQPGALLPDVEQLGLVFAANSPTSYYGLVRWWSFMAYAMKTLRNKTRGRYDWVGFDAPAKVGKQVRAHADWYVLEWLKHNAHTYPLSIRLFREHIHKTGIEEANFWDKLEPAIFESIAVQEPVPGWFAEDDPIHAIYERDPAEWRAFEIWIADLTGQKLTRERKEEREEQKEYAKDERSSAIARARELLETYYMLLDAYDTAQLGELDEQGNRDRRTIDRDEARRLKPLLGKLVEDLAKLDVPDPATLTDLPHEREDRPKAIVTRVFGTGAPELADPNVFKESELFDPKYFKIDPAARTIRHTEDFQREFESRFGRDSECVMRRAARAMWEHYRRHGPYKEESAERASQYSLLYAVMLAYISWIYPCPADAETRMAETLRRKISKMDLQQYLRAMTQEIRGQMFEGIEAPDMPLDAASKQEALRIARVIRGLEEPATEEERRLADLAAIQVEAGYGTAVELLRPTGGGGGEMEKTEMTVKRGRGRQPKKPAMMTEQEMKTKGVVRRKKMTPNESQEALSYLANARQVLPSPFRMIAAMTVGSVRPPE